MHGHGETVHIPFPFDEEDLKGGKKLSVHKLLFWYSNFQMKNSLFYLVRQNVKKVTFSWLKMDLWRLTLHRGATVPHAESVLSYFTEIKAFYFYFWFKDVCVCINQPSLKNTAKHWRTISVPMQTKLWLSKNERWEWNNRRKGFFS